MQSTELTYVTISGPEFDALVMRYPEAKAHALFGLASPRLKYFEHRSYLARGPDERVFILCTALLNADGSVDEDGNRFVVVGMLELEVAPGDAGTMWLKYLTVHPDRQRQGIAKHLLGSMVAFMQAHPRVLHLSRYSDEGELKIQEYLDTLLATSGITWTQSGR